MKKIYTSLLIKSDFVSFLSGMIVSGYVVEISVNPENTYWHWVAVSCGVLIGCLSYILISISKNFEDNIRTNKINKPGISNNENEENSWESIIDEALPDNKIFGAFPEFWMAVIVFSMPILFILGITTWHIGNQEFFTQNERKREEERTRFILAIDSINKQGFNRYTIDKKIYQDSLNTVVINLDMSKKMIDSLENAINFLKENKQK